MFLRIVRSVTKGSKNWVLTKSKEACGYRQLLIFFHEKVKHILCLISSKVSIDGVACPVWNVLPMRISDESQLSRAAKW